MTRSPYCGRLDPHAPHSWLGRSASPRTAATTIIRDCPGRPVIEGGNPAMRTWPATVDYDADDRPCLQCGATVHLHDHPACPHGQVACDGCGHAMVCAECARTAELEALDAAGGEPPC